MAAPDSGGYPARAQFGVLAAIDTQHRAVAVIAMAWKWSAVMVDYFARTAGVNIRRTTSGLFRDFSRQLLHFGAFSFSFHDRGPSDRC
jgi:hypothetical protein